MAYSECWVGSYRPSDWGHQSQFSEKKAMKSRTILFIERTPFPPATEKLLIVKNFSDLALAILKNNFVN